MDGLFVLAFLFIFASSIVNVINEANKKKKQRDILNRKLDDIYTRTMGNTNKAYDREKQKREKVKKIGNLEKHYDEAIRDDYKERADDYFSEKSKKLDEYLSRDIKDRLHDYKLNKEQKLIEEKKEVITAENSAFNEIESEEIDGINFTKENLARSIVIKEILDKPLALRRINE